MSILSWELDRHRAGFQATGFRLELDLTRPDNGIRLATPDARPEEAAQLLGIMAPGFAMGHVAAIIDPLVRGADLAAGYYAQPQWPIEVNARWRLLPAQPEAGDMLAVELLLSVHTQTLDSRPELTVESRMTVAETLALSAAPSCAVFRLPGQQWSYVEMVVPGDAIQDRWSRTLSVPPQATLTHRLFPVFLEKGVIFRSRLRGAVVPRDNDTARAEALWRSFTTSQTPLD